MFDPADGPDVVSAYPESYPTFDLEARGGEVLLTFRHFPMERFVPLALSRNKVDLPVGLNNDCLGPPFQLNSPQCTKASKAPRAKRRRTR